MRTPALTIALLPLLVLAASSHAQGRRWQGIRHQKFIAFDCNCSRKDSLPNRALGRIVYRAFSPGDRVVLGTFGHRAFKFALRRDGLTVYFVPMVCGAVGNCTWRLYKVNPVTYLGEIGGQYIYTYRSSKGMPQIITYGHLSVSEGVLDSYVFRNGRYHRARNSYPIGPEDRDLEIQRLRGHKMPNFLTKARPQCKNLGL